MAVPWFALNFPDQIHDFTLAFKNVTSQIAAVVMHKPKTIEDLQSKYNTANRSQQAKIRILLVPGHEPTYGGAEFGSLKERNLTVELANDLQQILANNEKYEVFVTRSSTAWSPEFANYFQNSLQDIKDWVKAYQKESVNLLSVNSANGKPRVYHNSAPENIAYRLYGITKWSNENNIDIVLHIHFNDYPGHPHGVAGKYSGFTIYVPEKNFLNSTTTQAIAQTVFKRLAKYNPVSDLLGESDGITFEPDLIAIGAYNTADAASMLVEYGYIYEPQFTDTAVRDLAMKDLAFQTYLGLQDFFDANNSLTLSRTYDTLVLPYNWRVPISGKNSSSISSQDIYSLQTALISAGLYPPAKKDMNDCPRTGTLGPCTKASLKTFQNQYDISGEEGMVGEKTLEKLNSVFGGGVI